MRRHVESDSVPVNLIVIPPEEADLRLFGGASRAVVFAEGFGFVEVSRILGAGQRSRPRRSELTGRVHRERSHVGQLRRLPCLIARRGWTPLTRRGSACEGREYRVGAIAAAPREDFIGDLLSPPDAISDALAALAGDRVQRRFTLSVEGGFLRREELDQYDICGLNCGRAARCAAHRVGPDVDVSESTFDAVHRVEDRRLLDGQYPHRGEGRSVRRLNGIDRMLIPVGDFVGERGASHDKYDCGKRDRHYAALELVAIVAVIIYFSVKHSSYFLLRKPWVRIDSSVLSARGLLRGSKPLAES